MLSVSALPQSPRPAEPHQYFGPTNSSSVHEQITRILIPAVAAREWAAYAVDDAAAIGMEETARQSARMAGHDLLDLGHRIVRTHSPHRVLALVQQAWPGICAHDAKLPDSGRPGATFLRPADVSQVLCS
jgi:hypothetical protein